jgi:polyhydroxyalkanoate synthesis regulator phasin
MQGLHKRDIDKLDDELAKVKSEHEQWLNRQQQETAEWLAEKKELNGRIDQLTRQINDLKKKSQATENSLNDKLNEKGL